MSPFAPIGEQARWRIVYDRLKSAAVGDVVTYDELGLRPLTGSDEDLQHLMQVRLGERVLRPLTGSDEDPG